jgi:hypothetical protein
MNKFTKIVAVMFSCVLFSGYTFAQIKKATILKLNNENFQNYGSNWLNVGNVTLNPAKPKVLKSANGDGIFLNQPTKKNNSDLITKDEFGDIELEFDFMLTEGAKSGVLLQGRYEVEIVDSWANLKPSSQDIGAIAPRLNETSNSSYEGVAPLVNVAKAPGLWQHIKIKFISPKFNANGTKIENARFSEIHLNGVLIQQEVEVTGPTSVATDKIEKVTGPIVFKNEQGTIAFRNISYKDLESPQEIVVSRQPERRNNNRVTNPIILNPDNNPYLLRGFLEFEGKKLTHVISVGYPSQINYSYNLKQGSLFQIWRGEFLNVTDMWHERGEPQLGRPLGSVTTLSNAPALAVLSDEESAWPDAIEFDDLQNKGYTLDQDRSPTFRYVWKDSNVSDKISADKAGKGIIREINISNAPSQLFCRIADGGNIEQVGSNSYFIKDKSYYIQIDKSFKPVVRKTANGQELVVRYNQNAGPLTYSIIW